MIERRHVAQVLEVTVRGVERLGHESAFIIARRGSRYREIPAEYAAEWPWWSLLIQTIPSSGGDHDHKLDRILESSFLALHKPLRPLQKVPHSRDLCIRIQAEAEVTETANR